LRFPHRVYSIKKCARCTPKCLIDVFTCSSNEADDNHMAVGQNLVPRVNIKIAGKWMFIPLKMVLIGIDPYPYDDYP
jgi:hypothetical protein